MTRFRLTIEYDGRAFMGWQRQAHGPSVQQALEAAVHDISGEEATVQAAGRTDAGVHASAMTAHLDLKRQMTPFRLMEALNARLKFAGAPAAVLDASEAAPDFHARFSCIGRAYAYRIRCRRAPLTHEQGLVWRRPNLLDTGAMQEAANHLVGRHDFTTFRHVHCQAQSPVKTLDRLDISVEGELVTVHAAARSFLHHQVRSMVGALVTVGEGRATPADVRTALEACDRSALTLNAPPDGLWFVGAVYPDIVG
ncbi:tRNA pseudouridine(38-40) synthase TruA [Sandaracinobacteroides hominis]|uniref:tRNA pseudouridine(38-40) synthase TruA n=1 Tax=Sandaracinobacteroides hominis TaxID=2780086 RepID=UPI0018F6401F|nr:tRNA pseudouridine(38-40) synthase TruA [Sandaracinobacteroides hominis]